MNRFKKYSGYIVAFIFSVAVIAVYKTFDNFGSIADGFGAVVGALKPFIGAFVIAYILNMPAKRLEKLFKRSKWKFASNHAHGLSILVVYLAALLVVAFLLYLLIPALVENLMDFIQNLGSYADALSHFINESSLAQKLNLQAVDFSKTVETFISSIDMSTLQTYAKGVVNFTSGFLNVFVAFVASIYMLLDKDRLRGLFVRIMNLLFKDKTVTYITVHTKRTNEVFTNYIYSRLSCSIIMAVLCSVILSLMGVKYALILGIFIGLMDMIPYFGSIISSVIAVLITFLTGGFWQGFWSAVVLLILQQFDGNILGPKIMGDSLEMRPLWIIFAISVGGSLFGFIGMLISVPIFAIVRIVLSDYIETREKAKAEKIEEEGETADE